MSATPITTTIFGASLALLGAALSLPQPQDDGGDPVLIFTSMEKDPNLPWHHYTMLPPQHGIILGWWEDDDIIHACYWVCATGKKYDLPPTEIDGVVYTLRHPHPGVGNQGETVWDGWTSFNERALINIQIPGVLSADFNGDGIPNTQDVTAFLNAWNEQRVLD